MSRTAPSELLRFRRDPHTLFDELRTAPAPLAEPFDGWVFTSHADVSTVLRRPQFGRAVAGNTAAVTSPYGFLGVDPPDHGRLRAIVADPFQPRAVHSRRAASRALAEQLVRGASDRGDYDLVEDIALPLATTTSCELLGVDLAERELVGGWAADLTFLLEPYPPAARRAAASTAIDEASDYFRRLLEAGDSPGLLALLSDATHKGESTIDEAVTTCVLIAMAGHETTVGLMGLAVAALVEAPAQASALHRDPELATAGVEELLRYASPLQMLTRTARDDVTVGSCKVRAGSFVVAVVAAANRDPAVFAHPHELDLRRANASRHVGFGSGIHHCLGAALARQQTEVVLEVLAPYLPRIRIIEPPAFSDKAVVRSLSRLRLTLDS